MDNNPLNNIPSLQTVSRTEYWQHHVDQWRASGLSKAAYSQQYDLIYHQMVYWSAKLEPVAEAKPANGFVAVNVTSLTPDEGVRIRLPNGITIEGISDRSIAVVTRLIAQL